MENKDNSPDTADAAVEWLEDGSPWSRRFADSYASRAGGLAETGYVFIAGNSLPQRWPRMLHCTIAELGFGTGLNFLETLRQWRDLAPGGARLHFVSFERYPMRADEIARALALHPAIAPQVPRLLDLWEGSSQGLDANFGSDVRLTVHFGDAKDEIARHDFLCDAWYLDGFAPARNPDMWSEELMRRVFDRTAPGGTFATYAAAGWVRRNLQAAGFTVERKPGFAGKREMLSGRRG
jgi:tRNA U34 5-methylaminomethyl-2-thiouridine-forming methyltransferase MnmC